MSWESYRKLADNEAAADGPVVDKWAEKNCPLLYSGFCETTFTGPKRSRLTMTLFMSKGEWRVKVVDRTSRKIAWLECESLEAFFENCEAVLKAGTIQWDDDKYAERGT
jgi:hypothetical protein